MNQYCLLLGSNSDIGKALAYKFASQAYNIILASRKVDEHQLSLQQDIIQKHAVQVICVAFDATHYQEHDHFWNHLPVIPDVVISAVGYLGKQQLAISDFSEAYNIMSANYVGQVSLLNRYVQKVKGVKAATIIGISSVAGERGRKSNFMYGSSKAAFTNYLSGLRNDLWDADIHVMTVLPGFVKTKMLGDLQSPKWLTALPEEVAESVWKAFQNKKNVLYVYPIWKYIMFIIKCIPEFMFKKMKL